MNAGAIGTIVAYSLFSVLALSVGIVRARRTSARSILNRLRTTGQAVSMRVHYFDFTWNPGKPLGQSNPLFISGEITYTLDQAGIVHLDILHVNGAKDHLEGRIPAQLVTKGAPSTKKQILQASLGALLLFTTFAFALGFDLSSGPTGDRIAWAILGAILAWLVIRVAVLVWRIWNGSSHIS